MVSLTHLGRGVDCSSTKNYQWGKPLQVRLLIVVHRLLLVGAYFVIAASTPLLFIYHQRPRKSGRDKIIVIKIKRKKIVFLLSINGSPYEKFAFGLDGKIADKVMSIYDGMSQRHDFNGKDFFKILQQTHTELAEAIEKAVKDELRWQCLHQENESAIDRFPLLYLKFGLWFKNDDIKQMYVEEEPFIYNRYDYNFTDYSILNE